MNFQQREGEDTTHLPCSSSSSECGFWVINLPSERRMFDGCIKGLLCHSGPCGLNFGRCRGMWDREPQYFNIILVIASISVESERGNIT